MATSGNIKTNYVSGGYTFALDWSIVSEDVGANTSDVKVDVKLISNSPTYAINSSATKNLTLTVNGKNYTSLVSAALTGNQTRTLFSKTVTVPHNADGSKTCAISANLGIAVTLSGTYYANFTTTGNAVLDDIPRASTISALTSNVSVDGKNTVDVTIARKSNTFTHDVQIKFGTYSNKQTNVATTVSYAIPQDWLKAIPNATSGVATVYVTTKNGSTKIGDTVSKTFKITVPATVKPTFTSLDVTRIDGKVPTSWNIYVQGKSKAQATITGAAGVFGSTIKKYEIAIGDIKGNDTTLEADLPKAGTVNIKGTITDSRGRIFSRSTTIDVVAYKLPVFTNIRLYRALESGVEDDEGTYIGGNIEFTYSAIGANAANTSIEYRLTGASDWTYAGAFESGKAFTLGAGALNVDNSYDIRLGVSDALGWAGIVQSVSTGFTTLDLMKGGRGIAFGKAAESEGMDVAFNARFRDVVQFDYAESINTTDVVTNVQGGVTITDVQVAKWGRFCTIHVKGVITVAIPAGDITNKTLCTLKDTLKPLQVVSLSSGSAGGLISGYYNAAGNVILTTVGHDIPANGQFSLGGSFICVDTSGKI